MNLSPRQRDFLSRLLDLYHETHAPVHYVDVARALNVKPVTAYEMLRLLEDKHLLRSEVVRPQGRRGRSVVLFSPTDMATTVLDDLAGHPTSREEWETAKANILSKLEQHRDYQAVLNDLLLRLPERKSPLLFAADMITAIILVFYELRDTAPVRTVLPYLRRLGAPGWAALYALAGFSVALSLVEKANRRATSVLLSYSQEFREQLDRLSGGEKADLTDFVSDLLRVMGL